MHTGEDGTRFPLISGQPLEEPVAWYGPIVMDMQAELQQTVSELRNGNSLNTGKPVGQAAPWPRAVAIKSWAAPATSTVP